MSCARFPGYPLRFRPLWLDFSAFQLPVSNFSLSLPQPWISVFQGWNFTFHTCPFRIPASLVMRLTLFGLSVPSPLANPPTIRPPTNPSAYHSATIRIPPTVHPHKFENSQVKWYKFAFCCGPTLAYTIFLASSRARLGFQEGVLETPQDVPSPVTFREPKQPGTASRATGNMASFADSR